MLRSSGSEVIQNENTDFISAAFYHCFIHLQKLEVIRNDFDRNSEFSSSGICKNLARLLSNAILNVIDNFEVPEDELEQDAECTSFEISIGHANQEDFNEDDSEFFLFMQGYLKRILKIANNQILNNLTKLKYKDSILLQY